MCSATAAPATMISGGACSASGQRTDGGKPSPPISRRRHPADALFLLPTAALICSPHNCATAADRVVVSTPTAPGVIGPYSQAIIANGFVFVSGQLPLVPGVSCTETIRFVTVLRLRPCRWE